MKRYVVIVPPNVKGEIRTQVQYIARHSIDNALAWEDRLQITLESLRDFHGHAIDEGASKRYGQTLRKTVFEWTYLIFYKINDAAGHVIVASVRHGARQPKDGEP